MCDNWTQWSDTLLPDVDCAWESESVLYLVTSVFNHFTYGGGTCNPMRRAAEYASRIAQGPTCRTPQSFFRLMWDKCRTHADVAWRLSHWTLVPLAYGGRDKAERLARERHMIHTLNLQLKPPLVHALLREFVVRPLRCSING